MAADQERADRIRALKQERPDLTWRRIAEHVGVTERSATDWQRKGGMEYDNAKKLAELFEVDIDYIWRGTPEEERAPSPFAGQDDLADMLAAVSEQLAAVHAQNQKILSMLVDGRDVIDRLDRLEQAISSRVDDAAAQLESTVAEARSVLQAASQGPQRAASKRAPKRTRTA